MKFATKPIGHCLTLSMLLHYLGKLKLQFFCRYSTCGKNANELHFMCTDFNLSTRVAVYAECIFCSRH